MAAIDPLFTSGSSGDLVPEGDAARQAVDSLRGYAYQVLASSLAWIDIGSRERLYLEVAEDYTVVAEAALRAVQVKDTAASGTATLNSQNVREAIASYVDLVERNAGKTVALQFLTTSAIGLEKIVADRPGGIAGLLYWRKAAAGADVTPLRRLLEGDGFPERVREFCRKRDDASLRFELLQHIRWSCGEPDFATLRADLEGRLIVLGRDLFFLPSQDAKRIVDILAFQVLRKSVLRDPKQRVLDRSQLYELIGQASDINLPRAALPTLAASFAGSLAQAGDGRMDLAAVDPGWLISSRTLPLPKQFIARVTVQAHAALALSSHGCAILTGATGLGKSHIARTVALQGAGNFVLADFRDLDIPETRRRLDNVFTRVGGLDVPLLIFEDLNHLGEPSVSRAFGRVMEALRYRDRSALITCYTAPSARSAADASIDLRGVVACTYFSEDESSELVTLYGGDREVWGKLAHVAGAFGHPQLTHAFVVGIAARGWPKSEVREVVNSGLTSGDIAAEQESARKNLIAALPGNAKALLFRLSFLLGRFDRPMALELGQLFTPIEQTGEALDVMVGPWIEPMGKEQYRLSPLASGIGSKMLTLEEQQALHAGIAIHMLKKRTINSSDIDAILMHAMLGKSHWALVMISIGILTASQDKLPLIAESVTVFKILNTAGPLHFIEPATASMVRLAQFKILDAAGEKEQAAAAAAAARRDVSRLSDGELKSVSEVLVLSSVLSTVNIADYLDDWVTWLQQFKTLMQSSALNQDIQAHLKSAAANISVDPFAMFFCIGVSRMTSVSRLESVIDALSTLDATDRNVWLAPMAEPPPDYALFINGPWAVQQANQDFDSADAVERYARIAEKTKHWDIAALTMQAWIARAVVLDEYLLQSDAALRVLDEALKEFGYDQHLLRAKAKIYWRCDDHSKALEILRGIADVIGRDSAVERAFALREAAISAAKCEDWQQAETWFREARVAAASLQTGDMQAMAVGLGADAAVAGLQSAKWASALNDLSLALKGLSTIDPKSSLRAAYCHQAVRKAILWCQSLAEKRDMLSDRKPITMQPGSCSNPDPPEAVRSLPLASLDVAWYMLAEIEITTGFDAGIAAALGDQLVGGEIPIMEMGVRSRRVERAIEFHDSASFARSFILYIDAVIHLTSDASELSSFDALSPPRGTIPAADLSTERAEKIAADAILAFGMRAAYVGSSSGLAALDVELIRQCGLNYVGHRLFDRVADQKEPDLLTIVKVMLDELESGSALSPDKFWLLTFRFFEHHNGSNFSRLLFPKFAEWLRSGWRRILREQAFLLFQPLRTTPAIQAALAKEPADKSMAASLLLASAEAVSIRLGKEYRGMLDAVAEEGRL